MAQLAVLAQFAAGHSSATTFAAIFQRGVIDRKVRDRLTQVRKVVTAAIARGAPDLGGVDASTHAFLSALQVWHVSEGPRGADYLAALDRLSPIATSYGLKPIDLFGHLTALAQDWGVTAGVVDASSVRRQLRRRGLGLRESTSEDLQSVGRVESVDADAVVRGPVAAVGLTDMLDKAERMLADADPAAASSYAQIASRLEAAGYWPHAAFMRRQEAEATQRAGHPDEAMIALMGLAWNHLEVVQPWEAGFALEDGRRPDWAEKLSISVGRARKAVGAAVWVAKGSDLEGFIAAFDALEEGDPYRERAAAFLCEEAIAAAAPQHVVERRNVLEAIVLASAARHDDAAQRSAARVQMCLADATGRWAAITPEIHRRYRRPIVAWAHARYGRYLALSGDGPGAQQQYLLAIERACVERMFDDAADWLYALRTVRHWYSDIGRDEQHPLAQALRANSTPSGLPGSPHTAEHARRAMLDLDSPSEALRTAQRWRWQTVVRGQLAEELEAVRSLAQLQQRLGQVEEAVHSFVRAGAPDQAAKAAKALPDRPARLQVNMHVTPVEAAGRPRSRRSPRLPIFLVMTTRRRGRAPLSAKSPHPTQMSVPGARRRDLGPRRPGSAMRRPY
ncbi:hypothetical protein ACFQX7_27085 [Luedemannella flava]